MDTAKFQIEIWKEETKRMAEPNVNDSEKLLLYQIMNTFRN